MPEVFDYGEAVAKGQGNALRAAQIGQYGRQIKRERDFETAGATAAASARTPEGTLDEGKYLDKFTELLDQGGLVKEALELRQIRDASAQRKTANTLHQADTIVKALTIVRGSVPLIQDQEGWDNFRTVLEKSNLYPANVLPKKYDPKILMRIAAEANSTLKTITRRLPGGKKQDVLVRDGNILGDYGSEYDDSTDSPDKPTTNLKKMRELISQGVPDHIAQSVAYGGAKEARDVQGLPVIIDLLTGQEIGHMEKDPKNPFMGQGMWVPNPGFSGARKRGAGSAAPGLNAPMPLAGPTGSGGGNILTGPPVNVGPSVDPDDIRRYLMP